MGTAADRHTFPPNIGMASAAPSAHNPKKRDRPSGDHDDRKVAKRPRAPQKPSICSACGPFALGKNKKGHDNHFNSVYSSAVSTNNRLFKETVAGLMKTQLSFHQITEKRVKSELENLTPSIEDFEQIPSTKYAEKMFKYTSPVLDASSEAVTRQTRSLAT